MNNLDLESGNSEYIKITGTIVLRKIRRSFFSVQCKIDSTFMLLELNTTNLSSAESQNVPKSIIQLRFQKLKAISQGHHLTSVQNN